KEGTPSRTALVRASFSKELAHGSAPNRSGRRRAGFVCRYMPTTSVWDRRLGKALEERSGTVEFAKRDLYLVRGRDVSGQNTVVTDR
ncbi:MAG: hypothetical protein OXH38_02465, partial [Chloroflexi bacterium]|nr:hypothetical protein [Chloroflexota bacterium]